MTTASEELFDSLDDDTVSIRPEGSRLKKVLIALAVLVVMGLVITLVARNWINAQLDPEGTPVGEVAVTIEEGSSTSDIANQLEELGVIPNSFFFQYYTNWQNEGDFQAGEYTFQENMSAEEAVVVLNEGPAAIEVVNFRVREGAWISEIIPELAAELPNVTEAQLQTAMESGMFVPRYRPENETSWEGVLFPDTYEIRADATAEEVVAILLDQFAQETGNLSYGNEDQRPNRLSPYEVLIVASLVEAEAKTDTDRPKIARVIYNRLLEEEWLGIDATLVYEGGIRGQIPTFEQLETVTPYNTSSQTDSRDNIGLPPTPIGVPSRASLDAAINPEPGPWFWYVLADDQGNHFFTDSEDEFAEQVIKSREAGLL